MLRSIASLAARHWREYWLRETLCLLAVAAVTALLYAGNLSDMGPVSAAVAAKQLGNIRYAVVLLWIAVTAVYTLATAFRGYGDAGAVMPRCCCRHAAGRSMRGSGCARWSFSPWQRWL